MPLIQTVTVNNQVVWPRWVSDSTTVTSNSSASTIGSLYLVNNQVWANWTAASASTTYTSNDVWVRWCAGSVYTPVYAPVNETPEQRAAREQRVAEARRVEEARQAVLRAERDAADRRAEALLRAHLLPEQQEQLAQKDWFLLVSKTGKKYRINRGRSANVDVLDEHGRVVRSLCAHPRESVPDADTMLSQALLLKYDEEQFLRMANVHNIDHGFRRQRLSDAERADRPLGLVALAVDAVIGREAA